MLLYFCKGPSSVADAHVSEDWWRRENRHAGKGLASTMEGFFSKVGEKQLFVVLPPTRTFATRRNLYPDVADQILKF